MTVYPNPASLAQRQIYNPTPGSFHYKDLISKLKDGVGAQDRPSAFVVGLLFLCKAVNLIMVWEGQLFQLPFVKGMNIRAAHPNFGHPFLGPDDKIMVLGGRVLSGSAECWDDNDSNEENTRKNHTRISDLTEETITSHPNYEKWLKETIKLNGAEPTYTRTSTRNKLKDCDSWFIGKDYTPGPDSTPLDDYKFKDDVIGHPRNRRPSQPHDIEVAQSEHVTDKPNSTDDNNNGDIDDDGSTAVVSTKGKGKAKGEGKTKGGGKAKRGGKARGEVQDPVATTKNPQPTPATTPIRKGNMHDVTTLPENLHTPSAKQKAGGSEVAVETRKSTRIGTPSTKKREAAEAAMSSEMAAPTSVKKRRSGTPHPAYSDKTLPKSSSSMPVKLKLTCKMVGGGSDAGGGNDAGDGSDGEDGAGGSDASGAGDDGYSDGDSNGDADGGEAGEASDSDEDA